MPLFQVEGRPGGYGGLHFGYPQGEIFMYRKAGLLALVLAVALLASGTARAMPLLAGSSRPAETTGVIAKLWDWFTHLFQRPGVPQGGITSTWEADGSHMDPNGHD